MSTTVRPDELTALSGAPVTTPTAMNAAGKDLVARGDLDTTVYRAEGAVGRYQGNGRFGCVFSRLGLHAHPSERERDDRFGHTQFMHLRHWGRFHFRSTYLQAETTADYLLPLARIHWENLPTEITDYRQTQSFYDGTLTTTFKTAATNQIQVTSWFDPRERDLGCIQLHTTGEAPAIILAPVVAFQPYPYGYRETAVQTFTATQTDGQWVLTITCPTATPAVTSRLYLKTEAHVEPCPEGLRITPPAGRSALLFSYGKPVSRPTAAESLETSRHHWNTTWQNSAWFDFPEQKQQALWVRSLAYILSSFNDDGIGFTPTNGLTGNVFPFNFAQDLFYVHPVLLATGHTGIAKSWIERFAGQIDAMKAYARRLWPEVEGIYPPWELPFGEIEGYHTPSVPIFYCYEPHNAAYLARMAHDTSIAANDTGWTEAHARPLIREIARFYRSFCRRGADGLWHLALTPAIGQDEAGGRNQADYLCNLYSAKYSFQCALKHGLDDDGSYQRILDEGLAFPALLSERGFYYASAGAGAKDFGQQKHPVQLNGLAYLPVEPAPLAPERIAYAKRYETTERASQPYFFGWTLGEFLLAGTHLGDPTGWRKDWSALRPSNYTDEAWVQLYETSGTTHQSFYITTHGLVAQSLAGNIVNDYWGELRIGGNAVHDAPVRFGNVRSTLGVLVSGEVGGPNSVVTLAAWKACTLTVNGVKLSFAQGETKTLRPNAAS